VFSNDTYKKLYTLNTININYKLTKLYNIYTYKANENYGNMTSY